MSNVNVVRTALAGMIQTNQYIGEPAMKMPNSTLNQKLAIHPGVDLTTGEIQKVVYVAIGNGGHDFTVGANGRKKWIGVHHTARHAALYNQLPFVLRRVSEDLDVAQRQRYRLRRLEEHHGESYVAYYLRVLDMSNVVTQMEIRRVQDGVTTSIPYTPTLEDLNPTPPTLIAGQAVTTTGEYIATTAKVPFEMSVDDVQEFVNACEIIYGEEGYAVISEVTPVAGVDRLLPGEFNGVTEEYTEVIRAQVTSFISTAYVMDFFTDGVKITLDIGNVEPLLNLQVA